MLHTDPTNFHYVYAVLDSSFQNLLGIFVGPLKLGLASHYSKRSKTIHLLELLLLASLDRIPSCSSLLVCSSFATSSKSFLGAFESLSIAEGFGKWLTYNN